MSLGLSALYVGYFTTEAIIIFYAYRRKKVPRVVIGALLAAYAVIGATLLLQGIFALLLPALFFHALNALRLRHIGSDYNSVIISKASWTLLGLTHLFIAILIVIHLGLVRSDALLEAFILFVAAANVWAMVSVLLRIHRRLITHVDSQEPLYKTVSLLIPARNEDHALEDSLRTALAIDYDRIEIIALNDASQDNTSQIIRQFAHDGVRFIENGKLPEGWLGKNYALQRLGQEASGEYLVFCDVDTRMAPQTLAKAMHYMEQHKLEMLSIIPKSHHFDLMSSILQPMTLLWQFMTPQFIRRQCKTTSPSCWIITRELFEQTDYLNLYPQAIQPQRYFAQHTALKGTYKLLLANDTIDVSLRKKFNSLSDTRIRSYFPMLNGNLGTVFGLLVLVATSLIGPYILLFAGVSAFVDLFSTIAILAILSTYLAIVTIQHAQSWPFALVNFLPSLFYELWLLGVSVYRYEFSPPEWKQRTIPSHAVIQDS